MACISLDDLLYRQPFFYFTTKLGARMRLLDLIAQSLPSQSGLPPTWPMPDPHHFAQSVHACPLRLVLADDLIRCSTALAYAEGDRLSGCLDLVRVPSERLWVEWAESPRLETLSDVMDVQIKPTVTGGRGGVLINSDATGRAGTIRSFWSTPDDKAYCAALITEFDLDLPIRRWKSVAEVFNGEAAGLSVSEEPAFDELLSHIRFRFDPAWSDRYRSSNLSSDQQSAILCTALGSTAFVIPTLFALFLLLAAKGGAQQRVANLDQLNRTRRYSGKTELLEHVEAFTSLGAQCVGNPTNIDANSRVGRRLHHVRGHLARRGYSIVWRSPHLRGNARLGVVQSRTVKLSFS
jgi:hypothetical protein